MLIKKYGNFFLEISFKDLELGVEGGNCGKSELESESNILLPTPQSWFDVY